MPPTTKAQREVEIRVQEIIVPRAETPHLRKRKKNLLEKIPEEKRKGKKRVKGMRESEIIPLKTIVKIYAMESII